MFPLHSRYYDLILLSLSNHISIYQYLYLSFFPYNYLFVYLSICIYRPLYLLYHVSFIYLSLSIALSISVTTSLFPCYYLFIYLSINIYHPLSIFRYYSLISSLYIQLSIYNYLSFPLCISLFFNSRLFHIFFPSLWLPLPVFLKRQLCCVARYCSSETAGAEGGEGEKMRLRR